MWRVCLERDAATWSCEIIINIIVIIIKLDSYQIVQSIRVNPCPTNKKGTGSKILVKRQELT